MPLIREITALGAGTRYVVRGDSMGPALHDGDYVAVNRLAYANSTPARGDLVLVRDTGSAGRRFLKRVVGLPGEELRLHDGLLWIDGRPLDEPYLGGLPSSVGLDDRTWQIGAAEYFLLGDNRTRSTDSRRLGPIPAGLFVGKVWLRYWPPRRLGRVR